MVLDLVVTDTDDGFTADIPSIKGCESWAHTEDEVIDKTIDLLSFLISIPEKEKIKIDRARKEKNRTVYKLVFDKA
jgi:predicted RNase H-like HicB family nuclease